MLLVGGALERIAVAPSTDQAPAVGSEAMPPIRAFAASMATDGRVCDLYRKWMPAGSGAKSPFVSASPPPERPQADRRTLDVTLNLSVAFEPALGSRLSVIEN